MTVLGMHMCREVEGEKYIVSDFSRRSEPASGVVSFAQSPLSLEHSCYDDKWDQFLSINIAAIVVYPVGIPLFYLVLLLL